MNFLLVFGTILLGLGAVLGQQPSDSHELTRWEKVKDTISQATNAIKDAANSGIENAKDLSKKVKENVESAYDAAKDKVEMAVDKLSEKVDETKEKAKQAASKISEKTKQAMANVKEQTKDAIHSAQDKISSAKDVAKNAAEKLASDVKSKAKQAKEYAEKAMEATKERFNEAKEKLKEASGEWKEKAEETAEKVKETVKEKAEHAKIAAKETYESAKVKAKDAMESVKIVAEDVQRKVSPKFKEASEAAEHAAKKGYKKAKELLKKLKGLISGDQNPSTPPTPQTHVTSEDVDTKIDLYIQEIINRVEQLYSHSRAIFENAIDHTQVETQSIIDASSFYQFSAHSSQSRLTDALKSTRLKVDAFSPDVFLKQISEGVADLRSNVKATVEESLNSEAASNCSDSVLQQHLVDVYECIPTSGTNNEEAAKQLAQDVEVFVDSITGIPRRVVSCINDYYISGSCFEQVQESIPAATKVLIESLTRDVRAVNENLAAKGYDISECISGANASLNACAA